MKRSLNSNLRRRPTVELLESRLVMSGVLAALPADFLPEAVAQAADGRYAVVGQSHEEPAVARVDQSGATVQTTLEILDGLPVGDGRGMVGGVSRSGDTLVGASQTNRSAVDRFGEATFWNAAGAPSAPDQSTIPSTDDLLTGVSEGGVASGYRDGFPIVASIAGGVQTLPGGEGSADAITGDGLAISGVVEGAPVVWRRNSASSDFAVQHLDVPADSLAAGGNVDVSFSGELFGGVLFSQPRFSNVTTLWDGEGRALHQFGINPTHNVKVDESVAVFAGVKDEATLAPELRIFLDGFDKPQELRAFLADEQIDVAGFSDLIEVSDVVLDAETLIIVGRGVSGGAEQGFVAIVNDFQVPAPQFGAIGDRVFHDMDHDGIQDVAEGGVPNVDVSLIRVSDDAVVDAAVTDRDGFYSFTGVAPGEYLLDFVSPADAEPFFTHADAGADDALDSDVVHRSSGRTNAFSVAAGQIIRSLDAGLADVELPQAPYQNPSNRWDVDNNGEVEILDILHVIRDIRRHGIGEFSSPDSFPFTPSLFTDVDGNNERSLNDALQVVRKVRERLQAGADGEPEQMIDFAFADFDQTFNG